MRKILLLKHDTQSTTGTLPAWCRAREIAFEEHAADLFFAKPHRDDYEALIVFGGDMEAWETEKNPWLVKEKAFIKKFIDARKPVFGICLGAQLLAEQMGAEVSPSEFWQFGWFDVQLADGRRLKPLHSHSSSFSLPRGATRLAHDEIVPNQGFVKDEIFVGYQFHVEIDQQRIDHILSADRKVEGEVQSPELIRRLFSECESPLRLWLFGELDQWRARSEAGAGAGSLAL